MVVAAVEVDHTQALGLRVFVDDPAAIGCEAGIEVRGVRGHLPLVAAIGADHVDVPVDPVPFTTLADRQQPLAVGRPVMHRVGRGDRHLGHL